MGMYYNRKLFREAGWWMRRGSPKPPANRAEFLEALRKLTRAARAAAGAVWVCLYQYGDERLYLYEAVWR